MRRAGRELGGLDKHREHELHVGVGHTGKPRMRVVPLAVARPRLQRVLVVNVCRELRRRAEALAAKPLAGRARVGGVGRKLRGAHGRRGGKGGSRLGRGSEGSPDFPNARLACGLRQWWRVSCAMVPHHTFCCTKNCDT